MERTLGHGAVILAADVEARGAGMDRVCRRVTVRGRVQGVAFRYSTCEEARAAGVAGWVRNRPDGTVEAHFEGEHAAVARLVGWCREGPRFAEVVGVEVCDASAEGLTEFEIR